MPLRIRAIFLALPFVTAAFAAPTQAQNRGFERAPAGRTLASPEAPSAAPQLQALYKFSGVRDGNAGPWAIGTMVMCSNHSNAPINARVRIFGVSGTSYANSNFVVEPLHTYTVVTRTIPTYPSQLNLNLSAVSQGFGMILSDRAALYCTVQVVDALNSPPAFMSTLHMERSSF